MMMGGKAGSVKDMRISLRFLTLSWNLFFGLSTFYRILGFARSVLFNEPGNRIVYILKDPDQER